MPQEAGSFGRKKSEPCPAWEWPEVPERQVGTERLSALLGQGVSPPCPCPSGEISHSGLRDEGCLVPGLVSMGAPQGLGWLGLWKAPVKARGEGGLGDLWGEVQAWWVPFLAVEFYPRRRHGGTGLSPGVYMQTRKGNDPAVLGCLLQSCSQGWTTIPRSRAEFQGLRRWWPCHSCRLCPVGPTSALLKHPVPRKRPSASGASVGPRQSTGGWMSQTRTAAPTRQR